MTSRAHHRRALRHPFAEDTMPTQVPELHKKPGVSYAFSDDGLELPVIDITHPAFELHTDQIDVDGLINAFVAGLQSGAKLPAEAMRAAAARSILLRGMLESADTYTTGVMTYLHKLGPDNLGDGYATPIDRQWAAGLTPLTFRWRMRDVATLLAEGLAARLAADPSTPLDLVNIGGGPAPDSFNALILLAKSPGSMLSRRTIRIHVLDLDPTGPAFGTRAVEALREPGAALAGLDVALEGVPYNWTSPARLGALLETLSARRSIAAVSSEGALFEYAADDEIVANLKVIAECAPSGTFVVGPVVRDAATMDPRMRFSEHVPGRPAIRYIGLAHFTDLAGAAGWAVSDVKDGPMHQVVRLDRAA